MCVLVSLCVCVMFDATKRLSGQTKRLNETYMKTEIETKRRKTNARETATTHSIEGIFFNGHLLMPFTGILTCCLFCISDLMCFVSVRCVCVWFFLWISVFTPESSSTTPFSYISSLAQCHVRHETDRSQAFVDDVPFDLWHKCSLLYDYTMSHCAYFPYLLPSTFLHELCSFFLPSKKCVYDGVMNIQSSALDLCVSCSSHISIDIHKIHIRKIIIRYFGWSCD